MSLSDTIDEMGEAIIDQSDSLREHSAKLMAHSLALRNLADMLESILGQKYSNFAHESIKNIESIDDISGLKASLLSEIRYIYLGETED